MLPIAALLRAAPLIRTVDAVRAWQATIHQQARRNAMLALTECTQRRVEREEVERYLADRDARAADPTGAVDDGPAVSLHA